MYVFLTDYQRQPGLPGQIHRPELLPRPAGKEQSKGKDSRAVCGDPGWAATVKATGDKKHPEGSSQLQSRQ